MLSVIIATQDSERALVPTLAALVPGATAGIVREVIVADGGSRDATARGGRLAPAAGSSSRPGRSARGSRRPPRPRARRGCCSCARASCPTRPGSTRPGASSRTAELQGRAGTTPPSSARLGDDRDPRSVEALSCCARALGAGPSAEQGLLIAKALYDAVGRPPRRRRASPSATSSRRIGRRRIVTAAQRRVRRDRWTVYLTQSNN